MTQSWASHNPKCVNCFSYCTAHKKHQLEGNAPIHPQYRIVGNYRGRKLSGISTIFTEKTFTDCSLLLCQRMLRPQIVRRKLLHKYSHKTARFAKVFFLKSFPLYGIDRKEHPERNWKTLFNTKQNKCATQSVNVQWEAQLSITKTKIPKPNYTINTTYLSPHKTSNPNVPIILACMHKMNSRRVIH